VRAVAVGLLAAGVLGGVYLGHNRDVQQRGAQAQLAIQADADDLQLLKARQNDHAAARAQERVAESDASAKAAVEAKAAAVKASSLRQAMTDRKAAEKKAKEQAKTGTVPYTGPIPTSCQEFVGNRATGCALMLNDGFPIDQFPCLNKLWNKESGWNAHAANKGSGAYGIPQALPGHKMSSAGSDWETNPATQIKWGLGYIKGRYKTPCGAWSTSENTGAY
jgi:hypothetical protein